jgi:hypothetical protein
MARTTPEGKFKDLLHKEIEALFPGCIILIGNSACIQGIPDWVIFYENKYAFLEVKPSAVADKRPNQDWWVDKIDSMSFSSFIYPENKEEVLHDLQLAFGTHRASRVS